jgi:hypothetical protein
MTIPLAPAAADVLGADLHPGSVVVDAAGHPHTIDHLREYPGDYKGDHARRAYDAGETWRCTVGDHEHFHCVPEEES